MRLSVVIFRLSQEWLALPTIYFKEVIHRRSIHSLPHRRSPLLLGLINLNGELQVCINLHALLEIEPIPSSPQTQMIALTKEKDVWVFPVDEIEGIDQWNLSDIKEVPLVLSPSKPHYIKGCMIKGEKKVKVLDEELLFMSLKRSLH